MDALALLCNLYGDGPATLKRLRVNGVLRIEDLSDRPAGEVATILELTPATARRFMKEAAALRKRVLDSIESVEQALDASHVKRAPHEVVRGKRAILAAASRHWEELERTPIVEPRRESAPPKAWAPATPLAAAEFDHATHAALAEVGVQTLEQLAAADSENLSRSSNLGLSQVLFAQGIARRKARESSAAASASHAALDCEDLDVHVLVPPPRNDANFSPSERPPQEWLSTDADSAARAGAQPPDEAAGPFA